MNAYTSELSGRTVRYVGDVFQDKKNAPVYMIITDTEGRVTGQYIMEDDALSHEISRGMLEKEREKMVFRFLTLFDMLFLNY